MYKNQFKTNWKQPIFTKPEPSGLQGYSQENFVIFRELPEDLPKSHAFLKEYYDISNWTNENVKREYESILISLGAPTHISNKPNGIVIWQPTDKSVVEHILRDENNNFFYTTVKMNLNRDIVNNILNINKSIIVDLVKNTITVRSNSIEQNMEIIKSVKG